jgi:hypothetical protein
MDQARRSKQMDPKTRLKQMIHFTKTENDESRRLKTDGSKTDQWQTDGPFEIMKTDDPS